MKIDKTKLRSHIYLVILLIVFVILWQFLADRELINPMFLVPRRKSGQILWKCFPPDIFFRILELRCMQHF